MDPSGDEPHDLDSADMPPEGEPEGGPIKAWSSPGSGMYQHGMQSVQLKTVGNTHKAACLKFYGSDPVTPTHARLEITQHRKVLGGFDFAAPPELKFYLEDDEIRVLKSFLAGQFLPADGYYVRVDSKEMAAEVAKLSADNLGDVLAAISDKTHLVEAIQASGHADFLADYVTNEKKRVEIGHLETAVWDPDASESVFQRILQRNPWMFGGQYVATGQRSLVLGEQFDVPLITADGSLHLIELKKATATPIVRKVGTHWMVGGPVHEAVSQTQNYLCSLDEDRHRIKADFGIEPRRLHATVVIGHFDHETSAIPMETVYETLRIYNSHMTRITVMTYDQLVTNARNAVDILGHVAEEQRDDEDQDEYQGDDDPWAGYPGPGPDDDPEPF
ncbi:Shedu anti-phage system protein SduA domain-containing protein [Mycobacterium sp. 1081908.1]|uniref:Shedu anti-phage system protein SduA domain-containing protein n=1 Tax=Mycobacterium sp. 1081908.1 TaxID=1834066 RepID=UPI0012EA8893|nr:Shedu anti-phage system protein SduA domain-containing protein [Mycobacterium sp. 1081908.1]